MVRTQHRLILSRLLRKPISRWFHYLLAVTFWIWRWRSTRLGSTHPFSIYLMSAVCQAYAQCNRENSSFSRRLRCTVGDCHAHRPFQCTVVSPTEVWTRCHWEDAQVNQLPGGDDARRSWEGVWEGKKSILEEVAYGEAWRQEIERVENLPVLRSS